MASPTSAMRVPIKSACLSRAMKITPSRSNASRRDGRRVLTGERVLLLEPTSGTTGGEKLIPYTESLRRQFQHAVAVWIADLFRNRPAVRRGRAYWSISPALAPLYHTAGGVPVGFEDDAGYLGTLEQFALRALACRAVGGSSRERHGGIPLLHAPVSARCGRPDAHLHLESDLSAGAARSSGKMGGASVPRFVRRHPPAAIAVANCTGPAVDASQSRSTSGSRSDEPSLFFFAAGGEVASHLAAAGAPQLLGRCGRGELSTGTP